MKTDHEFVMERIKQRLENAKDPSWDNSEYSTAWTERYVHDVEYLQTVQEDVRKSLHLSNAVYSLMKDHRDQLLEVAKEIYRALDLAFDNRKVINPMYLTNELSKLKQAIAKCEANEK